MPPAQRALCYRPAAPKPVRPFFAFSPLRLPGPGALGFAFLPLSTRRDPVAAATMSSQLPASIPPRGGTGDAPASDTVPVRYGRLRLPVKDMKTGRLVGVSPALAAELAGELVISAPRAKKAGSRQVVSRVAAPARRLRPVATISRTAYEDAGFDVAPAARVSPGRSKQHRSGGRKGKGGRPLDTRRDTWRTLGTGMMRATCAAVLNLGFEACMRRLFDPLPPATFQDQLCADLCERAVEFYRGEVWPRKHAFGVLSRYIDGDTDGQGRSVTPSFASTWLNDSGVMCCSCVGRSLHIGRQRVTPGVDTPCTHSQALGAALGRLCRRMGVSPYTFRRQLPPTFAGEDVGTAAAGPLSSSGVPVAEKWDEQGPVETFRAGQSTVAVVVPGLGPCKVVVPVLCTRKSTACAFCNTAEGFSCVHALRCRSVRRGQDTKAKGRAGKSPSDDEEDAARSSQPIAAYNCPRSERIVADVCALMQQGKVFESLHVVSAHPARYPTAHKGSRLTQGRLCAAWAIAI